MYLKSIEVQGFKSFAHKTTFEFHNGITAIVGPNGSGKSNVADAVRWVFGEQSAKQLRGSNMQDIIFAGTQTRRPQSFASVSLTLDNSDHSLDLDYAEVTVTRKVYRSGESEYLINNNNCRLKDILELFYDTGIGKEGYSIIGQGQVDKIISGKMDERRELFDEACGIVKFKKRKTAAVRKLEKEQTDMLRISDLVSELERQAGPLKRQSETAREYLRLRDELRAYDINAFLIDYNRYREQLEETARNLSDTVKELEEKKAEEQSLRERYASLEETLSELETDLEELRRMVNEATEEKTSLEGKISVVKEKIRADETQAEHYKDRISAIETEIREKEQEIEALKAGSLKNQEEAADLKKACNELQRKLQEQRTRISLYKKTAEENQQGLMDLLAEKDETTSRLSALNTLLSQETLRLQETEEQLKSVNKTIEEAEEKLKTLSGDEKDAESSLSSKKDELAELQRELDEADLSYEALRQEINDNNQKFQINRSRYETLRAVQEQYEGFNNAVRRVMEVRSRYPGICGVVSDLIRVDKKFRTAIEAALGGNYQNIVTEDQKTARDLISFLKESRSGRATFLPLDAVRPIGRLSDERILKEPGVYGTANTLTEADKRYDNVVRNLLERIVVVEDLKTASDLARKYRYQIRMVTLEGDILAVGGSMTGGSFKNNNHYLGRAEELEALSRTNERLKSETAEKEKELNLKKQLKESLQVETDDLREEIQDIILKLSGIRSSRDHQNSLIRLNRMESKELASRKEEILESIASHETEKLSIEDTVKQLEALNASSDSSRSEVAGLLQEAETEEARLSEEAEALRLKQSEAAQREQFNEESLERLAKDIGRLEEEKEELNDNLSEISENTSEKEEEIRTLEASLHKAEVTLAGMENDLKGYSESRDSMTSQQKAYFDQRDSLSTVISDLNREEVRLQSQQEKLEERIDNQVNYLWSEYELTPSEAEKFRDETLDNPSRIRRHAQELKTAIRQLGNVNVNAIEQYNEVSERYETMTAQYQDLKKAEEDLKKIIQDLDEGMRRQFTERFAAISDEYDRVFKELFGGGQGTLEIREGDILESDIQIISQPPGKKLQNMMQLSGGEKALSAIALIFAIQNLKPSPFCLLDEIEAALDDSNVGRFTGYLRKLTHSTQFIVITHRRGTMVAADRLYGITMQEKGVSALISVNLVEGELSN